jgi:hypothetical protein
MAKVVSIDMAVEMVLPDDVETIADVKRFLRGLFIKRLRHSDLEGSVHRMVFPHQVAAFVDAIEDVTVDWWVDAYPTNIKVWDVTISEDEAGTQIDWLKQVLDTTHDGVLP